jgi:hypothetical protein
MKEAFSQGHKIVLHQDSEKEKKQEPKKKKTTVKKETLQKMVDMGLDIKNVFYEEDALAKIEEKQNEGKEQSPKRDKKEQILYEATVLASQLEIPLSESVGVKAILQAIKEKIDERKKDAGADIAKMAEALAFEVSYKAICTENEVLNNTKNQLGVASLADYNRFRLGL